MKLYIPAKISEEKINEIAVDVEACGDAIAAEKLDAAKAALADAKAAFGKDINDLFRFGSDNIELTAFKMCEDGSGDAVIRFSETSGKETRA